MYKKYRLKRAITLLEGLIAFALFGVLATTLFMSYQGVNKISQKTLEWKKTLDERSWAYHRIEKTLQESDLEEDDSVFFTEGSGHNSLVFTYNNGIDSDPKFSSTVLGKIYLNAKNELCLATWPINSKWGENECRVEVLLKNVKDLSFEFYLNPVPSYLIVETEQITQGKTPEPKEGLSTEWLIEYETLPHHMKVIATQKIKDTEIELALPVQFQWDDGIIYLTNEKHR